MNDRPRGAGYAMGGGGSPPLAARRPPPAAPSRQSSRSRRECRPWRRRRRLRHRADSSGRRRRPAARPESLRSSASASLAPGKKPPDCPRRAGPAVFRRVPVVGEGGGSARVRPRAPTSGTRVFFRTAGRAREHALGVRVDRRNYFATHLSNITMNEVSFDREVTGPAQHGGGRSAARRVDRTDLSSTSQSKDGTGARPRISSAAIGRGPPRSAAVGVSTAVPVEVRNTGWNSAIVSFRLHKNERVPAPLRLPSGLPGNGQEKTHPECRRRPRAAATSAEKGLKEYSSKRITKCRASFVNVNEFGNKKKNVQIVFKEVILPHRLRAIVIEVRTFNVPYSEVYTEPLS
ncbi:hypothetical protein EVAR_51491_1 [Eumeta japonica]|uniref:Uncharacterized protein n=1 Tax=Eumeta variegata TaxID=151549 RepID=A0A4C1XBY6_EUMVA|nr:hypothetical protein EVAR_51491_1 [Eumeta japonica]